MRHICIIGDNFMLSDVFEEKLFGVVDKALISVAKHSFNWPGDPLVHGHTTPGMDGLKEYFGTAEHVIEMIGNAEILITHLAPLSRQMLEKLPALKMVAVSRGGPVNVDLQACQDRNILVVNTPGRNASAVAEFTIGAILTESRNIRAGHEDLRQGIWSDKYYRADTAGRELSEMTIGIVGYGAIGRLVIAFLKAFKCKIIVHDPYAELTDEDLNYGVIKASMDDLLRNSDVVSLHSKVTSETIGMMNSDAFSKMKPDALLINTTRGSLCDDDAIIDALSKKKIGGAVIDTFTTEPLPKNHPLLTLPNVTLTPHIAGASVRTVAYAAERIADEVKLYLADQPPLNPQ